MLIYKTSSSAYVHLHGGDKCCVCFSVCVAKRENGYVSVKSVGVLCMTSIAKDLWL